MKALVFDSSSLISLAVNNLFWTLRPLRQRWGGVFLIPASVRYEVVEKPLRSRKYKLEAIMIKTAIEQQDLVVHEEVKVEHVLGMVNTIFSAQEQQITIVQRAEVEALLLAVKVQADAYVVDERTMRLVIEDPKRLHRILEKKLHTKVRMDKERLRTLQGVVKGVKIIRSTELMMVALEKGILDGYLQGASRRELADAILWGLRLRGCAIATEEIEELVQRAR